MEEKSEPLGNREERRAATQKDHGKFSRVCRAAQPRTMSLTERKMIPTTPRLRCLSTRWLSRTIFENCWPSIRGPPSSFWKSGRDRKNRREDDRGRVRGSWKEVQERSKDDFGKAQCEAAAGLAEPRHGRRAQSGAPPPAAAEGSGGASNRIAGASLTARGPADEGRSPPTREAEEGVRWFRFETRPADGGVRSCVREGEGEGRAAEGDGRSGGVRPAGEPWGDPFRDPVTRAECRCLGSPKRQYAVKTR